jgi:hypothetical protein
MKQHRIGLNEDNQPVTSVTMNVDSSQTLLDLTCDLWNEIDFDSKSLSDHGPLR